VEFALVHNRPLTPFVITDHAAFVGIYALIRRTAAKACKRGLRPVTEFGSPFPEPGNVAGRRERLDYEASSAPLGNTMPTLAPLWLRVRWKRSIVERDLVRSNTMQRYLGGSD
jgi:hypothetical protein